MTVKRRVVYTMLVAVVASVPLAGFVGALFRFPIPFAGYRSGPAAFGPAIGAALFYGLLGGVLVQAAAGALGGWYANTLARRNPEFERTAVVGCGILAALPGLLTLAILDWIIGRW